MYICIYAGLDSITLSDTNVNVKAGEDVVIDIMSQANPMPEISVTKSGNANSGVDLLTNEQFGFDDVTKADTGTYSVEAANFAGTAKAAFSMTVTKDGDSECSINSSCMHAFSWYDICHLEALLQVLDICT